MKKKKEVPVKQLPIPCLASECFVTEKYLVDCIFESGTIVSNITDALGVDSFKMIAREVTVSEKRVDIIASAVKNENHFSVPIEVMFGTLDNRHFANILHYMSHFDSYKGIVVCEGVSNVFLKTLAHFFRGQVIVFVLETEWVDATKEKFLYSLRRVFYND